MINVVSNNTIPIPIFISSINTMPISYSLSSSSFILPNLQFRTKHHNRHFPNLKIRTTSLQTNNTIQFLKPYLTSQQKPILYGWLCSAISVYSLSNLLSKFSAVTTATTTVDVTQGFALGGLVLVRLIATYAQHALLWEASLNAVYDVRVHVFDRVMQRELAFFEGNDAVSSGDIAYRITAEASDLAATLYALLNVSFILLYYYHYCRIIILRTNFGEEL